MKRIFFALSMLAVFSLRVDAQWVDRSTASRNNQNSTDHDNKCVFMYDGSMGWMGGTNGTILKTSDGGDSWLLQHGPENSNVVTVVRFLNASTGYALARTANQGYVYVTTNGGNLWTVNKALRDSALADSATFNDVTFTTFGDSTFIWLTAGGDFGRPVAYHQYVYVSKDTGRTWTNFTKLPSIPYLTVFKLYFFNPSDGVISGGNVICRTSNGGETWDQLRIGPENNSMFFSFQFIDSDTGFFAGQRIINSAGYVILGKTYNGAMTWLLDSTKFFTPFYDADMCFVNSQLGFNVTLNSNQLYRTTNGGTNWTGFNLGSDLPLFDVNSADGKTVVAVGAVGKVVKSADSGKTWSDLTPQKPVNYTYVKYLSKDLAVGYGVGNELFLSSDSCKTWTEFDMPTALNVHIAFADSLNAWIADDSSRIYHSINSGRTWTLQKEEISGPPNPPINGIHFFDDATGCAVGDGGYITATTDSGRIWISESDNQSINLYGVFVASKTRAWAVGAGGIIIVSYDQFHTWIPQSSPVSTTLRSVVFTDTLHGSILGDGGIILTTTNGGTSWIQESSPDASLNSMSFPDAENGWVVGNSGKIYRTQNGGKNWESQESGVQSNLNGIDFVDDLHGVAVGDSGVVLTTGTGGVTSTIKTINLSPPQTFELGQNYPNPFNPTTIISYELPANDMVRLEIYDILGRKIETLLSERQNAGNHSVPFNASNLSSGVYFYRLSAGSFVQTKKLMLIK